MQMIAKSTLVKFWRQPGCTDSQGVRRLLFMGESWFGGIMGILADIPELEV